MTIVSLNVNNLAALRLDAGCWALGIMTYIKGILDGGKDNVVFLQEMPTDYRDRIKWAPVAQDFVKHFPEGTYKIFKSKVRKKADIYTIAIVNADGGWSDQAGATGFSPGQQDKTDWLNRIMELVHPSGLRVLGLHAPMREIKFFESLYKYAEQHGEDNVVILGDMNVHSKEPDNDYYKKFHSIRTEDGLGYTDLVKDGTITYFPEGHALDHVLVSPVLKGKADARVYPKEELELSDHAVIFVDIQV